MTNNTKFILKENRNSLIDYDATCYLYSDGYSNVVAYLHDLYSENPYIEFAEHIVDRNTLKLILKNIDSFKL